MPGTSGTARSADFDVPRASGLSEDLLGRLRLIDLLFARPLTGEDRTRLQAGLRSADAFVLRRCRILLASARGERVSQIARVLACHPQTVLNAIHAFNDHGLRALDRGSSRPHDVHSAFDPGASERLREMLRQSPRVFGKPRDEWTLALAAEVSAELGLTSSRVSPETVRATLARLGIPWNRAKRWAGRADDRALRRTHSGEREGLRHV